MYVIYWIIGQTYLQASVIHYLINYSEIEVYNICTIITNEWSIVNELCVVCDRNLVTVAIVTYYRLLLSVKGNIVTEIDMNN